MCCVLSKARTIYGIVYIVVNTKRNSSKYNWFITGLEKGRQTFWLSVGKVKLDKSIGAKCNWLLRRQYSSSSLGNSQNFQSQPSDDDGAISDAIEAQFSKTKMLQELEHVDEHWIDSCVSNRHSVCTTMQGGSTGIGYGLKYQVNNLSPNPSRSVAGKP